MIADLISDTLNIRLITRNIISVFSNKSENTDLFIHKLKHSKYVVDGKTVNSDDIIGYLKKDYNIYENIFRFVSRHANIDCNKFEEYLNYLDLQQCLMMHFYQLSSEKLRIIENLILLSSNKQFIILDYIDDLECKSKFYSLIFNASLDDKCIIIPFSNISDATNDVTCQCYVKSPTKVKMLPRFSNEFLNYEFNTHIKYYTGIKPAIYHSNTKYVLNSYRYSVYEILLIVLFAIKLVIIKINNWRFKYVSRLYS